MIQPELQLYKILEHLRNLQREYGSNPVSAQVDMQISSSSEKETDAIFALLCTATQNFAPLLATAMSSIHRLLSIRETRGWTFDEADLVEDIIADWGHHLK